VGASLDPTRHIKATCCNHLGVSSLSKTLSVFLLVIVEASQRVVSETHISYSLVNVELSSDVLDDISDLPFSLLAWITREHSSSSSTCLDHSLMELPNQFVVCIELNCVLDDVIADDLVMLGAVNHSILLIFNQKVSIATLWAYFTVFHLFY
jgi:hypothetical protein